MKPAALAMAALAVAGFASAQTLTRDAWRAHGDRVQAEYEAAVARCKPLEANERDMCKVRATATRHVARAELEARYKPGPKSEEKLALARADAAHAIAREQCDDLKGSRKEICRKDAKAALAAARADAKTVRSAALSPELQALGRERCDSMTGTSRELCVADLQRRNARP